MIIEAELNNLSKHIIDCLSDKNNNIAKDISDYLTVKSKRIRPVFVFLFTKAMGYEVSEKIYNLACGVELIHNSTLVHDDILDNADTRRGRVSLNYKLGNSLSVLAGDILLSSALKELVKCGSIEVIDIFSQSLYIMCKGEINQNFAIDKIPDLKEYIKKSEYKTAELYKASLTSLCAITNKSLKDRINDFAKNFGIAFQIKDDLLNILKTDNTKPALSDIYNGIYTAPVIFLNQEKGGIENLPKNEIIELIQSDKRYINKTVDLIEEYVKRAIEAADFLENNEYKQEIIRIAQNLYKAGINE